MTDSPGPAAGDGSRWEGLLDPATRAVAGSVLAVVGLLGPNALTIGVQAVLGSGPSPYLALALGTALLLGLALWLAVQPAREAAPGWVTTLSRAAVVVSLVGFGGVLLLFVAGLA